MPVAIDSGLVPLFFTLGRPFSSIYACIMKIRAFCYEKGLFSVGKLPCPVISIGNLTLGGTGKTPHVLAVADHLAKKGLRVAVVTRGYGAKEKKMPFVVFNDGEVTGTSTRCGDEAFMLSEALSARGIKNALVIVDADRYRGGRLACELSAQVILLDDGFQHMSLHRDLNIVLFRHKKPLGNGRVFPGGDLREPLSALKRGQVFVFTGADGMFEHEKCLETQGLPKDVLQLIKDRQPVIPSVAKHQRPVIPSVARNLKISQSLCSFGMTGDDAVVIPSKAKHQQVFFSHTRAIGLESLNGVRTSPSELKGRPVLAFCGLANPNAFYAELKKIGADVKKTVSFSDHFAYKEENVQELMRLAEVFKCSQLVTTHKDMVKLRAISCALNHASRITYLDIDVEIDTEFWEVIDHILNLA